MAATSSTPAPDLAAKPTDKVQTTDGAEQGVQGSENSESPPGGKGEERKQIEETFQAVGDAERGRIDLDATAGKYDLSFE